MPRLTPDNARKAESPPADSSGLPSARTDAETDRLFSQVLSIASDAIVVIGPDHCIKIFNYGAEELFGYSAEEVLGRPITILMPDRFVAGHGGQVMSYGHSPDQPRLMGERSEICGLKKDGSEFAAEASISKLQTSEGLVFTAVLRDISERKAEEALLRDSRDKFRSLIKAFQFGVIVHQNGKLVFANPVGAAMHGYNVEEVTGAKITDFIAPADLPMVLERAASRLEGETVPDRYEYNAQRKDGTTFPVEISAQTIDWYGSPAILSAITDITDQKRAEAAESRLGRIIEQSLNEVYIIDANTLRFLQVNHGARTNLGYTMDELRDLTPADLLPEYTVELFDDTINLLRSEARDKLIFKANNSRKDGSTYDIEAHVQFMKNEDPPVFVAIAQDITKQNKTEEDLRLAVAEANRANRSKSEFLSNMSHEIRTPMNGVLGMTEVLLGTDLSEKQTKLAMVLAESGQTLMALLNDILDLAKIEAGKVHIENIDFSLQSLLDPVTALWQAPLDDKGLKFSLTVTPDINTMLLSDPGRITQILNNLIGNAVKFTEQGGVSLEVSQEQLDNGNLKLRFAITDTGIGINPGALEKLFDQFIQADSSTTRKHGGTGLGLAISKQLSELLGGSIGVESTLDQGSTFWFTIQCAPGDPEAPTN